MKSELDVLKYKSLSPKVLKLAYSTSCFLGTFGNVHGVLHFKTQSQLSECEGMRFIQYLLKLKM